MRHKMIASWPGPPDRLRRPRGVDHRVKPGDDDLRVSEGRLRHKIIASWPGKDPAIHVCRRPPGVDHRVKPGDDGLRVKPGDDGLRVSEGRLRHKIIASWPGKDPAIHVCRRPPGVDHRVK